MVLPAEAARYHQAAAGHAHAGNVGVLDEQVGQQSPATTQAHAEVLRLVARHSHHHPPAYTIYFLF